MYVDMDFEQAVDLICYCCRFAFGSSFGLSACLLVNQLLRKLNYLHVGG